MSLASALRNRSALWHEVLARFDYTAIDSRHTTEGASELRIRVARPSDYSAVSFVIDVLEVWVVGDDTQSLGVVEDDCHLHAASWHAQITPTGDIGAERLDLQRAKPSALIIHRHPFGEPNDVRIPGRPLFVPARWVEHVETVIYEYVMLSE